MSLNHVQCRRIYTADCYKYSESWLYFLQRLQLIRHYHRSTCTLLNHVQRRRVQLAAVSLVMSAVSRVVGYKMFVCAELPPPELVRRGQLARPFYTDFRVLLPLLVATLGLLGAASAFILCRKTREYLSLSLSSSDLCSSIKEVKFRNQLCLVSDYNP